MFISTLQWWKCLSNIYNELHSGLDYMEIDACIKSCSGEQNNSRILWRV